MATIDPLLSISEVQIIPVKPQRGLVAFCSFVVNGLIFIGDVAIHTRPDGRDFRLVYPVKKLVNGKNIQIVHPISKEAGEKILQAVISEYEGLIDRG